MIKLFQFYNSYPSAFFGYLSNSPGDLTGNVSNHVRNLNELKRSGIEPGRVVIMTHGVHITYKKNNLEYRERNKTGTENNFTFFYGDELIQRKTSLARNPLNFKKAISTPTLDGYLTGMADDVTK
ncbi:hypothetical protein DAPPUDRAFT_263672 [Daphnia pulex]|uniref:Uncharacterized protein n=1 Tax=Daphnia pulex TaxID=6669 RepID=E9HQ74_DAPPU|nr:hypothetical protein DAPPUDRAFT_263672 [Daphnia pulex]|eukprot:EFX66075.1 hypothetical protein DAPPUDRAFT_263672 [Daphnia pulex]